MNFYIELMKESIDFIEDNLLENITLKVISNRFYLSQYHFDRLFSIIVGTSFKQYVLGRKLTLASDRLIYSKRPIIDIAMDLGFQYPEVFSRAFKKQFGISPKAFRREKPHINRIDKTKVISRNLVNYNGGLAIKASYVYLNKMKLQGVSKVIDVYDYGFEKKLEITGEYFLNKTRNYTYLNHSKFYNLVNCNGAGTSTYTVYFGKEVLECSEITQMEDREIPESWYASFFYEGKMSHVRTTFEDDLFRWIALKEIKLNPLGVGMISIYDKNYFENGEIRILVPVTEPVT